MASNASKAITGKGDGLRGVSSGQEANPELQHTVARPQDCLVAVAVKNSRTRYEIWLRTFKDGSRRVVLGLREQNGRGVFKNVGPTIIISVDEIDAIHELLDEAGVAASREGMLS